MLGLLQQRCSEFTSRHLAWQQEHLCRAPYHSVRRKLPSTVHIVKVITETFSSVLSAGPHLKLKVITTPHTERY